MNKIKQKAGVVELHKTWKRAQRDLKWWRNETGFVGINIRRHCHIPLPHPESLIQIGCLYLLHLEFISQRNCKPAIFKYKAEVFEFLKECAKKYNLPVSDTGKFPW